MGSRWRWREKQKKKNRKNWIQWVGDGDKKELEFFREKYLLVSEKDLEFLQ